MSSNKPTLIDAKGMGGIIAQDGFDYQVWDALARLPAWLRNPSFEGFAVEALDDSEARFFAPHARHGHVLDRFQAKSAALKRSEIVQVLKSFREFDVAYPAVARVHMLVTPVLPATLTWLNRDPERVRRARPFYRPFADIGAAGDAKLSAELEKEFGPEIGRYFMNSVEISLRPKGDRATAEAAFAAALQQQFPDLEVTNRKLATAFASLNDLAASARGRMITRTEVLDLLASALGCELITERRSLPLHIRSDRNSANADAVEIDASTFNGQGGYPAERQWRTDLLDPLRAASSWALRNGFNRVQLSGSYRLTTALAIGWSFRSATGFELDIPTKTGTWTTDGHQLGGADAPEWQVQQPSGLLDGSRLVVGIGVLRDPAPAMLKTWKLQDAGKLLLASLSTPLVDAAATQASISLLKAAIDQAVCGYTPKDIALCYVGPAALAVALGHRWNALPPTQLHEFNVADGIYTPTALLA